MDDTVKYYEADQQWSYNELNTLLRKSGRNDDDNKWRSAFVRFSVRQIGTDHCQKLKEKNMNEKMSIKLRVYTIISNNTGIIASEIFLINPCLFWLQG